MHALARAMAKLPTGKIDYGGEKHMGVVVPKSFQNPWPGTLPSWWAILRRFWNTTPMCVFGTVVDHCPARATEVHDNRLRAEVMLTCLGMDDPIERHLDKLFDHLADTGGAGLIALALATAVAIRALITQRQACVGRSGWRR